MIKGIRKISLVNGIREMIYTFLIDRLILALVFFISAIVKRYEDVVGREMIWSSLICCKVGVK